MCTLALKIHLTRWQDEKSDVDLAVSLRMSVWCFKPLSVERDLKCYLRRKEWYHDPFKDRIIKRNTYSTFKQGTSICIPLRWMSDRMRCTKHFPGCRRWTRSSRSVGWKWIPIKSSSDNLEKHLQCNLSAFFWEMETVLRVSREGTQEIMEHVDQACCLSEPAVGDIKILNKHKLLLYLPTYRRNSPCRTREWGVALICYLWRTTGRKGMFISCRSSCWVLSA